MTYLDNSCDYAVWGTRQFDVPTRVKFDPDGYESRAGTVANAIARKNKLAVANLRSDMTEIDRHGRALSQHYELTLGKPMREGGYSISGSCWFSIKNRVED